MNSDEQLQAKELEQSPLGSVHSRVNRAQAMAAQGTTAAELPSRCLTSASQL